MTTLNVGTEIRIGSVVSSDSQQSIQFTIVDCIPSDYTLISKDSNSRFDMFLYANDSDSTLCVTIYLLENYSGAITIDTEDAEVWYNTLHEQRVMFVQKENTYQATWTDETAQKMYVIFGSNTAPDVMDGIVEKMLLSNFY